MKREQIGLKRSVSTGADLDSEPAVEWTTTPDRRPVSANAAHIPSALGSSPALVANRFVTVGGLFELEYAGQFVRIWCRACDKSGLLPNDRAGTVEVVRLAHRCGARTSDWGRGDLGVRA